MTLYLLDVASYQGSLKVEDVIRGGFQLVNLKTSHGLGQTSVHPDIVGWVARAQDARLGISTFHFLTGEASGAAQARYAYGRLVALGLHCSTPHQVDCESTATLTILRDYITAMQRLLERKVVVYTGDWWWVPKKWNVSDLTPYLWSAPTAGYPGTYPGDTSTQWAGFGGWSQLSIMQYGVSVLSYPDGTKGTIKVSKSAVRDHAIWAQLAGGGSAAMTAPVCDLNDLEQYAGEVLPDPWLDAAGWPPLNVPITQDVLTSAERDFRAVARAGWIVVPALEAMRFEFNAVAPDRDKASDGGIGDTSHAAGASGHNPDETGNPEDTDADNIDEVRARDFDDDLNVPGLTMEKVVQYLVTECRAGRITWIKYLIYNHRIWKASAGWVTQAYTGASPHTEHMHVSCKPDTASENNTKPLGLATLLEDDMPITGPDAIKVHNTDGSVKTPPWHPEFAKGNLTIAAATAYTIMMEEAHAGYVLAKENAKTLAITNSQLSLVLTAARAADDDAAIVTQADRLVAAITAVDPTDDIEEIKQLLAVGGGSPDTAAILAKLDALPSRVLTRVAAAQDAEAAALRHEE